MMGSGVHLGSAYGACLLTTGSLYPVTRRRCFRDAHCLSLRTIGRRPHSPDRWRYRVAYSRRGMDPAPRARAAPGPLLVHTAGPGLVRLGVALGGFHGLVA